MSKKTTITEACRWLSENMAELPEFDALLQEYMAGVQQQLKLGLRGGWWCKDKHPKVFYSWYKKWWKKHPELWGMVYEGCDAATNPDVLPPFMERK